MGSGKHIYLSCFFREAIGGLGSCMYVCSYVHVMEPETDGRITASCFTTMNTIYIYSICRLAVVLLLLAVRYLVRCHQACDTPSQRASYPRVLYGNWTINASSFSSPAMMILPRKPRILGPSAFSVFYPRVQHYYSCLFIVATSGLKDLGWEWMNRQMQDRSIGGWPDG